MSKEYKHIKVIFLLLVLLSAATVLALLFAKSSYPDTIARELTTAEFEEIKGRNSDLIEYIWLSPNADFPREQPVKKITIHHMAGDLSLENLGQTFGYRERNASSNYAIDSKGRVALYVEESNRSWASSSSENDQQAITIEVANDSVGGDWHVSEESLNTLVDLCVDICLRNGIKELNYTGDESGNLTTHQMFNTATVCPGPYLLRCMPDIANRVNLTLQAAQVKSNSIAHRISVRSE